jgi:DNA-directed RNA polymerase specialized sigma24 family protein
MRLLGFSTRRDAVLALIGAAVASLAYIGAAGAQQIGPQTVGLIDRLCAQTLRTNEEDRLYGMISLAVRATIRYRGGEFQPDVIDDAVQDSLDSMIEDCPELTEADPTKRLTMAVEIISDATTKVLQDVNTAKATGDKDNPYLKKTQDKVTAADLSEELSSQEIDQWLNALPPRQRALSLFLYASDVSPQEIAAAVGESPSALGSQFNASKADLLHIFHEEWQEPVSASNTPAIAFAFTGQGLAGLMKGGGATAAPASPTPLASTANDVPPSLPPTAPPLDGAPSLRVTGISDDLYAGWSLLATAYHLPRGQRISITEPFILQPDRSGMKRMLVTDIAEIGDPLSETRRFLLKAYAIDAEAEASGLRDSFHVGPPLDNDEAKKTLSNHNLSSIEVARCLWHDFGTGQDPGLCR